MTLHDAQPSLKQFNPAALIAPPNSLNSCSRFPALDSVVELDNLETVIKWQDLIESLLGERYFAAHKKQYRTGISNSMAAPTDYSKDSRYSFRLMLRNLIDNAIHYCPNGSRVCMLELYVGSASWSAITATVSNPRIWPNWGNASTARPDKMKKAAVWAYPSSTASQSCTIIP
jgi:hypothetical protein